jgi:hypothetical protein
MRRCHKSSNRLYLPLRIIGVLHYFDEPLLVVVVSHRNPLGQQEEVTPWRQRDEKSVIYLLPAATTRAGHL